MHTNLALAMTDDDMRFASLRGSASPRRWFVLTCEATRDWRAKELLCRQGYEAVSLKICVQWVSRRAFKDGIELMFPGYLLVRLDPETTYWKGLLETKFITGVLRVDGQPAPLPEGTAERFMERMDCAGLINPHEVRKKPPMRVYTAGQELRITQEGPWEGLTARYKDRVGGRLKLLMSLFGGEVEMIVPEAFTEVVRPS